MNDIADRLRRINGWTDEPDASPLEAADEIERLEALVQGLTQNIDADTADMVFLHAEIERLRDDLEMCRELRKLDTDQIRQLQEVIATTVRIS